MEQHCSGASRPVKRQRYQDTGSSSSSSVVIKQERREEEGSLAPKVVKPASSWRWRPRGDARARIRRQEAESLEEACRRMFEDAMEGGELTDMEFVLDSGRRIRGHQSWLMARCEYLREVLSGGMKEEEEEAMEGRRGSVRVRGCGEGSFLVLLEFVYTGRLGEGVCALDDFGELFMLADMFCMEGMAARLMEAGTQVRAQGGAGREKGGACGDDGEDRGREPGDGKRCKLEEKRGEVGTSEGRGLGREDEGEDEMEGEDEGGDAGYERRCTYDGCRKPDQSSWFLKIGDHITAGGQDWRPLHGQVLCKACYNRYLRRGTLERQKAAPDPHMVKRCTYEGCPKPEESSYFRKIGDHTTAGGRDWSPLHGRVLCTACYLQYRSRGTLERGGGLGELGGENEEEMESEEDSGPGEAGFERRCTYDGCRKPEESNYFFKIGDHVTAGGRDWSPLHGQVLCNACYVYYRNRGTLERGGGHGQLGGEDEDEMESDEEGGEAEYERRCTYDGCLRPEKSRRFYKIGDHTTARGRDWSSLHGRVLCTSCYNRYRERGTLERQRVAPDPHMVKRCTYEGCRKPEESSYFCKIDERITAGGRDWRPLHGQVLCASCYTQYRLHGTLERARGLGELGEQDEEEMEDEDEDLATLFERRCTYDGCLRPDESRQFYKIGDHTTAGGRDWSPLHGRVLCTACYLQYRKKGTMERGRGHGQPSGQDEDEMESDEGGGEAEYERRCTYDRCLRPEESRQFYKIGDHITAGGQDWSPLHGRVLCTACYLQYRSRGMLDRGRGHGQPSGQDEDEMESEEEGRSGDTEYERRCTYDGCRKPGKSSRFVKIGDHITAGGQDWSSLYGRVLCNACYCQYSKKGTLEQGGGHRQLAGEDEEEMESDEEGGDAGYERRCTYDGCRRPEESSHFYKIGDHMTAGGRDWSSLHGRVLCDACYVQYRVRGTLERKTVSDMDMS